MTENNTKKTSGTPKVGFIDLIPYKISQKSNKKLIFYTII